MASDDNYDVTVGYLLQGPRGHQYIWRMYRQFMRGGGLNTSWVCTGGTVLYYYLLV